MALYFVEYDLRAPGRNYQPLYDSLEALGAKRILESLWGLSHANTTCVLLRDHLKPKIDSNDRLIVAKVSDWASLRSMTDINKI